MLLMRPLFADILIYHSEGRQAGRSAGHYPTGCEAGFANDSPAECTSMEKFLWGWSWRSLYIIREPIFPEGGCGDSFWDVTVSDESEAWGRFRRDKVSRNVLAKKRVPPHQESHLRPHAMQSTGVHTTEYRVDALCLLCDFSACDWRFKTESIIINQG